MDQPRVKTVTRTLADGTTKTYLYDRDTGKRLDRESPTSPPMTVDTVIVPVKLNKTVPGTVAWLIREYWNSPGARRLTQSSRYVYDRALRHLDVIQSARIEDVKRRHIAAIHESLADRTGIAGQFLTVTRVLFSYAVKRDLIEVNPAEKIDRIPGGHWKEWTEESVAAWMAAASQHPPMVHLAFLIGLHTGMREGDILSLRWNQYDGSKIHYTPKKTERKVGQLLKVPATPELKAALDAAKAEARGMTIITSDNGKPMGGSLFRKQFMRAAHEAGCKYAPFHGLRKAAANRLSEAGATPHEIMAITGHSSLAMVELYTRGARQERLAETAISRLTKKRT